MEVVDKDEKRHLLLIEDSGNWYILYTGDKSTLGVEKRLVRREELLTIVPTQHTTITDEVVKEVEVGSDAELIGPLSEEEARKMWQIMSRPRKWRRRPVEYRKVNKIGNSLMVAIPPRYAEELGIEAGDFLAIRVEDGKLIMKKAEVSV